MRITFLVILLFCSGSFGCQQLARYQHRKQESWFVENASEMRTLLSAKIPPGTSLEEAKKFMESEGFECEVMRDAEFYRKATRGNPGKTFEHLDYLWCQRNNVSQSVVSTQRWSIAILLDHDQVDDYVLNEWLIGP